MIPKTDQVCSLEYAKRLKELGVKQDSYFTYLVNNINGLHCVDLFSQDVWVMPAKNAISYAAYTVAELGIMLGKRFDTGMGEDKWVCRYFEKDTDKIHHAIADTEADARAKMLIYLIENSHAKVEDINK